MKHPAASIIGYTPVSVSTSYENNHLYLESLSSYSLPMMIKVKVILLLAGAVTSTTESGDYNIMYTNEGM